MRRRAAAAALVLAAGSSLPAFASSLVTENFSTNTDLYWNHQGNTTASNSYGLSNSDNTGTAVAPPGGAATGAGELGGVMNRNNAPANFYAFDIGTIDPITESFEARGVIRLMSRGGSSGFNLGFFGQGAGVDPIGSYGSSGNGSNFIGLSFDDGYDSYAVAYDVSGARDRINLATNLVDPVNNGGVPGPAVPFSMTWAPPPAGDMSKGALTTVINGVTQVYNHHGALNFVDFTRFGLLGISSASGGSCTAFLDDLTFSSENALGGTPGWAIDDSGDYLSPANWIGPVPNGIDAVATFGSVINADRLVYADSAIKAGTLHFNNAHTYLLAGLGTLTLQVSGGAAHVNVDQGTHKINLPLVAASNTILTVAAGTTLKISDPVTVNSGASVTQSGAGTVLYESTVTVLGGGSIAFGNSNHLAALTVHSAGAATLTPGNNKALRVNNLSISGRLDLQDNRLITPVAIGSLTGSTYTGITGLVQSGRNGNAAPLWDGNGIVTSQANATGGSLTSIGVATGAQVKGIAASATAVWNGQTVTGSDTLVMYTYGGDATLDGKINVDDYGRIDFNVPVGASGWFNGDFNYDGKINVDDYGIIDFNIAIQGAPLGSSEGSPSALTAVPEPGMGLAISIVAAAAAAGFPRRRQRTGGPTARGNCVTTLSLSRTSHRG